MYLKTLEIQGFKSFSNKTLLDFSPGITCIVGPNGSGKSNISDAVRWVLGEQSAKTLRGSKMEDIIFAGTEQRRRVGFAQVSITIDNTLKILPIEFNEVTVTRRVHRSGESEYYINKSACRLKDVHELFMDTGLGKDGYSIVGQGRIDDILSTKSEDRRHVFEEAAGITKYKTRKQEAEKDLELTSQNLIRLKDIISELEMQIEPLHQQSEKAKQFLFLMDQLKTLEISVCLNSIEKLKESLTKLNKDSEILSSQLLENQTSLSLLEGNLQKLYDAIKSNDKTTEQLKDNLYLNESTNQNLKNEIILLKNNINNNEKNIKQITTYINDIDYKSKSLNNQLSNNIIEVQNLNNNYKESQQDIEQLKNKDDNIMMSIQDETDIIESLKTEIIEYMNKQSETKAKVGSFKVLENNFKEREESIKKELDEEIHNINQLKILIEGLQDNEEDIKLKIQKNNKDLSMFTNNFLENEKQKEITQDKINKYISLSKEKISKKNLLNEMEKDYDGYYNSVKNIMKQYKDGRLKNLNIHDVISQLIDVPEKFTTAIEIALGATLQNIVVENEQDAKVAINFLKNNKLGRATFLPISSVKGTILGNNNLSTNFSGYIGIAAQLIKFDKRYEGIINRLLGRVVIVDNIDTGIKMAKQFNHQFKIVTLNGEVLNPGGSLTGGSISSNNRFLSRTKDIEQLSKEIIDVNNIIENLKNELKHQTETVEKGKLDIEQYKLKIIKYENSYITIQSDLKHNTSTYDNLVENKSLLEEEKHQINKQIANMENEQMELKDSISILEEKIKDIQNSVLTKQEKHKDELILKEQLNQEILDKKVNLNSIHKDIEVINKQIKSIQNELEDFKSNKDIKNNERITLQKHNVDMLEQINQKDKQINQTENSMNLLKGQIQETIINKEKNEENIQEHKIKIKDIREDISLLQQQYQNIENKKIRLEVELENNINKLWDDYQHTFGSAMEYKKDIGNIGQAQKDIIVLKDQIKQLGAVNANAIEEYKNIKERFEFLSKQKDDLEQAEEELLKIITDIVKLMEKQFSEQFKIINKHFNIIFSQLFEGGKAELRLAQPDNILESGIEIDVQPPGKKLQNLMLLSGGEKAFTAIALLFAFLKVRPTPFCIFDEIEAALDDVNVYRFAEYLKQYSNQTQFILVTHRRGTMESADVLYGITMQERGVSDLISLNLDEVENAV